VLCASPSSRQVSRAQDKGSWKGFRTSFSHGFHTHSFRRAADPMAGLDMSQLEGLKVRLSPRRERAEKTALGAGAVTHPTVSGAVPRVRGDRGNRLLESQTSRAALSLRRLLHALRAARRACLPLSLCG
jgi:hypothetical protein